MHCHETAKLALGIAYRSVAVSYKLGACNGGLTVSDATVVDGNVVRDEDRETMLLESVFDITQKQAIHEHAAGERDGAKASLGGKVGNDVAGHGSDGAMSKQGKRFGWLSVGNAVEQTLEQRLQIDHALRCAVASFSFPIFFVCLGHIVVVFNGYVRFGRHA